MYGDRHRSLQMLLGVTFCLMLAGCGVSADEKLIARFSENEQCFVRMASSILSAYADDDPVFVRWSPPFEPFVTIKSKDSNFRDTGLWYECMWQTGTSDVASLSRAWMMRYESTEPKEPDPSKVQDRIVFFLIETGISSRSQDKGVAYVASDDLSGIGDVVPSLNDRSPQLRPQQYVFRQIKPRWYLFYEYYR